MDVRRRWRAQERFVHEPAIDARVTGRPRESSILSSSGEDATMKRITRNKRVRLVPDE